MKHGKASKPFAHDGGYAYKMNEHLKVKMKLHASKESGFINKIDLETRKDLRMVESCTPSLMPSFIKEMA